MYRENIIMKSETGLHPRPASKFVSQASKFKSDIVVIMDGQGYNAKSIMGLLSMGASKGDILTIQAEGTDAYEAVKVLVEVMHSQGESWEN